MPIVETAGTGEDVRIGFAHKSRCKKSDELGRVENIPERCGSYTSDLSLRLSAASSIGNNGRNKLGFPGLAQELDS